jgi:PqqD family protein of HPr-rel-A system
MTGSGNPSFTYRAERVDDIIVETLDMITLIYQKRSGITHLVAEPMPQILAAFGENALTVAALLEKLAQEFDFGAPGGADEPGAMAVITARLDELVTLGLIAQTDDNDA